MQRYGYILYLPNFCKVFFKKTKKNFAKKQKKFVKTLQNCKKMRNFVMILFCATRSNKTSFLIGTQKSKVPLIFFIMKLSQQCKFLLDTFICEVMLWQTVFINSPEEDERKMFEEQLNHELADLPVHVRDEKMLRSAMCYLDVFHTESLRGCWDEVIENARNYAEKVLDNEQQGRQTQEWHKENMPDDVKNYLYYDEEYKADCMVAFFEQMRQMQTGLLSLLAKFASTIK